MTAEILSASSGIGETLYGRVIVPTMAGRSRLDRLLDSFIAQGRAHGEWTVALARVVIAALLVARILFVGPSLLGGTPRQMLHVGILIFCPFHRSVFIGLPDDSSSHFKGSGDIIGQAFLLQCIYIVKKF